eukprot:gene25542-biopygen10518
MWDKAECRAPLKVGVLTGGVVSGCVAGLFRGLVAPVLPHFHLFNILAAPAPPQFFIAEASKQQKSTGGQLCS